MTGVVYVSYPYDMYKVIILQLFSSWVVSCFKNSCHVQILLPGISEIVIFLTASCLLFV